MMYTNVANSVLLLLSTGLGSTLASPVQKRNANAFLNQVGQSVDLKVTRAQSSDVSSRGKAGYSMNGFAGSSFDKAAAASNNTVPLHLVEDIFSMPVTIGSQTFDLLVDLGSADTWVPDAYFDCIDRYGSIEPQDYCAFGPTYKRNVDQETTMLDDVHMNVGYADGDVGEGPMARALMTLAEDITFWQEVGIASNAIWSYGDNRTSGVLGLAYANLSSKYPGTDFTKDIQCPLNSTKYWQYYGEEVPCNQINYDVVTTNLGSKMSSPYLTMSLSRDSSNSSNGGVLTFGGVGDLSVASINASTSDSNIASVPVEALESDDTGLKRFHIISVEGFTLPAYSNLSAPSATSSLPYDTPTFSSNVRRGNKHVPRPRSDATTFVPLAAPNGTSSRRDTQVVLDSGASQIQLAPNLAQAINSLFVPAAVKEYSYGLYYLDCDSISYIPEISVLIGGQQFPINPVDLVKRRIIPTYNYSNGTIEDTEVCYSAVSDALEWGDGTGNAQNVMGTPFLVNVAMVMDLSGEEGAEYAFISRPYYES